MISEVGDLRDLDKGQMDQTSSNLRKEDPPVIIPVMSQKKMILAGKTLRYYKTVGRSITAGAIRWTVIRSFGEQWEALKNKKDADILDVPKATRALSIMRWIEAFEDFLRQVIGVRMIYLYYVIRDSSDVPGAVPPLITRANVTIQPHSELYGLVEEETSFHASHDHPLFRDDNQKVYFYNKEAVRCTIYHATIKPNACAS